MPLAKQSRQLAVLALRMIFSNFCVKGTNFDGSNWLHRTQFPTCFIPTVVLSTTRKGRAKWVKHKNGRKPVKYFAWCNNVVRAHSLTYANNIPNLTIWSCSYVQTIQNRTTQYTLVKTAGCWNLNVEYYLIENEWSDLDMTHFTFATKFMTISSQTTRK